MAARIHRVTLFKLPKPADQQKLIDRYKTLLATNTRNGKPYILSLVAGVTEDDSRRDGFTVVSKTEFAAMDDMRYYDDECEAHAQLKAFAKNELTVEGVLTAFFTPAVVGGAAH
ncbi:stress responsive A/B barrel domain-containing protein [Ophiocordyceps camponoti-floridani]|uniref:Stress responsive A/B barrel domain-containing protein n=1 Tax=Ophiocordyceps camponoti-floridani TaxID=2030778 RepID=A0A8H4QD29_9HYPO|nr:stress responsive A/B barrel domain-containing protein [Ophiocordyceps camponoti-floridani]